MADANPFDQFDAKPVAAPPTGGPAGNPFDLFDAGPDAKPVARLSDAERDKLIRVVIGEAGAEPYEGKAAVAHVILNRAKANSREFGGPGVDAVIEKPNAFEPWTNRATRAALEQEPVTSKKYQQAAQIVDAVLAGQVADPTKGATFFYSPSAQAAMIAKGSKRAAVPSWAAPEAETAKIGRHVFYAPQGPAAAPTMAQAAPETAPVAPMAPAGPAIAPEAAPAAPASPVAPKTASMVPGGPAGGPMDAVGGFLTRAGEQLSPENDPTVKAYRDLVGESTGQITKGVEQFQGNEKLLGSLNTLAGALGYVLAPINAPIRSLVGEPVEKATGIPKEIPEFAAQLAIPGVGLPALAAKTATKAAPVAAKAATIAAAPGTAKETIQQVAQTIEKGTPSVEELTAASKSLFKAADDANVVLKGDSTAKVANEMFKAVTGGEKVIHPTVHSESWAALTKAVQDMTAPEVPLSVLNNTRTLLSDVARGSDARERAMAGELLKKFDAGMQRLKNSDVIASTGSVEDAVAATKTARELWKRKAKAEIIDDMIDAADLKKGKFSGSGLENAIRTAFRGLATNKDKMRQFSPDEQKAIKLASSGGNLATALRIVGKFAPTSFFPIVAAITATAKTAGAGIALPIAGAAARFGANKLATAQAERVSELIRSGGITPAGRDIAAAAELPTRSMFQAGLPVGRGLPNPEE